MMQRFIQPGGAFEPWWWIPTVPVEHVEYQSTVSTGKNGQCHKRLRRHIACSLPQQTKPCRNTYTVHHPTRRTTWESLHRDFSWVIKPRMGECWSSTTKRTSARWFA